MKIIEQFSVNNDCYKNNVNKSDSRYTTFQNRGARGLMLHSVGCPQPNAQVFANTWNKSGKEVAVHAVLQADGLVIQCLPWNFRGWHAGGSANNTHIGVEMTEPDCIKYIGGSSFTCSNIEKAKAQVRGTYYTAVELFAHLCKEYGLNPLTDIISHKEGCKKGVASNHGDPEHLWTQLKMGYTMDTFRNAVKEAMDKDSAPVEPETPKTEAPVEMYRVRKTWADAKSQLGAFRVLDYAKSLADKNPGYYVFNSQGVAVYPVVTAAKKTVEELAKEVVAGKWGNGSERKNRLESAGYSYSEVQAKVNELVKGTTVTNKKTVDELAREVIKGKWGNGAARKNALTNAGYDYSAVQRRVNELLKNR